MSALSDQLLVVAIFAYLLAMICHAVEAGFGTRRTAPVVVRERELATATVAAGSSSTTSGPTPDGPVFKAPILDGPVGVEPDPQERTGWPAVGLAGWFAVGATVLGALFHLACLVTRGVAAERLPWGNMYEYMLAITFVGVAAWLVLVYRRPSLRLLGLFVALVMVVLLGLAGLVFYTPITPLVPALQSYWYAIHVSTIMASSGLLLLGSIPATMFLLRSGYEHGRRGFPYLLAKRVPAAASLERLTFGLHAIGFPVFTFAVIAGAIWAEHAWSRPWAWDPKETWAFISWVIYAGYLHARATPSVRRTTVTWIAILGFLTMLMNLIGVNYFFESLHSYA
ncbi:MULTISPECIES: c-type cytochrome biogenesis protein CcsB [unclassified Solwaraspora]|uniref:c-type cytochrome biogenesis protein CcsB n=1 Tax=unclassified Solwaraspora TaxID=2627926 RepID=UPI00248BD198|nr:MULTISPECIES: c-type cytochrome biogenesis protein CcsB [unclassified Solwaraspora]WBB96660.1 c-type cytochrome biogenesis protein CcsB [Solwaraspora sp. WMMA2059]WBC19436.1 c-type cytochrome biogenesis protein CcsB [Solwaraspora sp. WMMA2080]WJK32981.1 c-type cytochrome biogenesis protein CcsB [Solwaraspora sp. WMMA2065]